MTREEIAEDIRLGDTVKLYTKTEEALAVEAVDFGASGLKVRSLDSGNPRRIAYSLIIDYEIITHAADQSVGTAEAEAETETGEIRKGIITSYNKKKHVGTIIDSDGSSIYFQLKQVNDAGLQEILETEENYGRHVTYIPGENFRGSAADEIKLDSDFKEDEYEYEGTLVLGARDIEEKRGYVRTDDGQSYPFVFARIIDPLLFGNIIKSGPHGGVQGLKVKFNLWNYRNWKDADTDGQKLLKIAVDIARKKEYSREEIAAWKETADKRSVTFQPVSYEPLNPPPKVRNKREDEEAAVALFLSKAPGNPFIDMEKELSQEKYFEDALDYRLGRNGRSADLDRAEKLFIKAVQAGEQTASSVVNLVKIYRQNGGDDIVKGLQLLEAYGYLFLPEKLTDLRTQLIEKSGNDEALEKILLSAVSNCSAEDAKWQYMRKLANIYLRQQNWQLAIHWLEDSLEYLEEHKSVFPQYEELRQKSLQKLENAQKCDVNDNAANNGIGEDDLSEKEDLQYENDFLDLSQYLQAKLQEVDLCDAFRNIPEVCSKTENGVFVGSAKDVKKARRSIYNSINEEIQKQKFPDRCETNKKWAAANIGIAKIIYDSENHERTKNGRIRDFDMKTYVGKFASYKASELIENRAAADSIRYMYVQVLNNIKYEKSENTRNVAMKMLTASFFADDERKLSGELQRILKGDKDEDSYYSAKCLYPKELILTTFVLQDKDATHILQKVHDSAEVRNVVAEKLHRMVPHNSDADPRPEDVTRWHDFSKLWKSAKHAYDDMDRQIGREVAGSAKEYAMSESARGYIQRIGEFKQKYEYMLCDRDSQTLTEYKQLLVNIGDTFDKNTVEEKIRGFQNVESEIQRLLKEIEDSPAQLSCDYVYIQLNDLRNAIRQRLNEEYRSSEPECRLELANERVYVDEKKAAVVVTFRNAAGRQAADDVRIELTGSEGAVFAQCERSFTSIKSGDAQDYIALFRLNDKVIAEGQFEAKVAFWYQFREAEGIKRAFLTKTLSVKITDKENFVPVSNKYDVLAGGDPVSVDTPELFKGRDKLIDRICGAMSSDGKMLRNKGIILWGQKRVGKNSVKDYLKKKIQDEYPDSYIIIEFGSVGSCNDPRGLLIKIIRRTKTTLEEEYEDVYNALMGMGMVFDEDALEKTDDYMGKFSEFMFQLSAKLKKIPKNNIPLYFFDEFTYLYQHIEEGKIEDGVKFMRFWKSFIQDYGICAIMIAQDSLPVWRKNYENEFDCMNHVDGEITYLDDEGARALICEPCQREGRSLFTPEAAKLIADWTKGSAFLIAIFCQSIIDYLNNNYMEKATKTIVQMVFKEEFLNERKRFESVRFDPQIVDPAYVGAKGDTVKKLNEKLLMEIAAKTIDSPRVKTEELEFFNKCEDAELAKEIFDRLRDRKIIEGERDTYCSIEMPLLKFYLLRKQELLNEVIDEIAG